MAIFRADFHVHTVLSPCASLAMSPSRIVESALAAGLQLIAITDHNSTRNVAPCISLGHRAGLLVLPGVEINSREEVHCLALFETMQQSDHFQRYIEGHLQRIPNKPETMGDQPVVNEREELIDEVPYYLGASMQTGITEIIKEIHRLGGLAIPSHIYRPFNGLVSQLGFYPADLGADALEVCSIAEARRAAPLGLPLIYSSDSHTPEAIGRRFTVLGMHHLSFSEVSAALLGTDGRFIKLSDNE